MQRVWSCACGWRSTAENVERINGSFGRGEAPPFCRRCRSAALKVTSEDKHPKVTRVCQNPDCRQDFLGWAQAKHCDKCRSKMRSAQAWEGRRKYIWTPERDQILKDEYKHNATAFAERWALPKWAVVKRASQLGLCRVKEKPWSKAEDAFIEEHAGSKSALWMARQLRTRTETAVVVRLQRLHISRRIAEGMTMGQLEQALGVDHRVIAGWVRSGRLPAERVESDRTPQQGGARYVFREPDITKFVLENPSSFRLDRVDQVWFMGLMREAAQGSASQPAKRVEVADKKRANPLPRPARVQLPAPSETAACIGVDERTPCVQSKTVAAKPGIPARCPDCKLEFRRRLHREEVDRLQRIHAVEPPAQAAV